MSLILSNSFNTSLGPGASVSGVYTDTSINTAVRVWAFSDKNIQLQIQYADNSVGSGVVNELYSVYANNNTAINSTRKKQWQRTIVTNPGAETAERVVVKTRHIIRSNNPVITYQSDDVTLQSNIDIEGLEITLAEETSAVQVWGSSVPQSQGNHHLLLTDTSGRLIISGNEELGGSLDVSTSSIQVWGSSVPQSQGDHRMLLTDTSGRLQVALESATTDDLVFETDRVLEPFDIDVRNSYAEEYNDYNPHTWTCDVSGTYSSASTMLAALEKELNRCITSGVTSIDGHAQFKCSLVDKRVKIECNTGTNGPTANETVNATYANEILTKTYVGNGTGYNSGISSVYPFPKGRGTLMCYTNSYSRACIGLARSQLTMDPNSNDMVYALWVDENGVVNYKYPNAVGGWVFETSANDVGIEVILKLKLNGGSMIGEYSANGTNYSFTSSSYLDQDGTIPSLYPVVVLAGSEGSSARTAWHIDPFLSNDTNSTVLLLTYRFDYSATTAASLGFGSTKIVTTGTITGNQLTGLPVSKPLSIDIDGRLNTNIIVDGSAVSKTNAIPVTACTDADGVSKPLSVRSSGLINLPPIAGKYVGDPFLVTVEDPQYIVYTINSNAPTVCQIPVGTYINTLPIAIEEALNAGLSYDVAKGMQWSCSITTDSPTPWTETRQTIISYERKDGFPSNFQDLIPPDVLNSVSWDQNTKTLTRIGTNPITFTVDRSFTKGSGAVSIVVTTIGAIYLTLVLNDNNEFSIFIDNGNYNRQVTVNGATEPPMLNKPGVVVGDIFGIRLDEGSFKTFYKRGGTIYDIGDPIPYNYEGGVGVHILFNIDSIIFDECHLDPYNWSFEGSSAFSQVQLDLEDEQTSNIIRYDLDFGLQDKVVYNSSSGTFTSNTTTINNERILNLDNDGNLVIGHTLSSIQIYGSDGITHRPVLTDSSGRIQVVANGQVTAILYGRNGNALDAVSVVNGKIGVSNDTTAPLYTTTTVNNSSVRIYGSNTSLPVLTDISGRIQIGVSAEQSSIQLFGTDGETKRPVLLDASGRVNTTTTVSNSSVQIYGSNTSLPVLTDISGRIQIGVSAEQSSIQLFGTDGATKRPVLVDASGKLILSGTIESSNVIYAQDANNIDTVVRVDSSGTLNTRLLLANLPVSSVNPLPNRLYGVDVSNNLLPIRVNNTGHVIVEPNLGELYPIIQGGAYQGLDPQFFKVYDPTGKNVSIYNEYIRIKRADETTPTRAEVRSTGTMRQRPGQRSVCRFEAKIYPITRILEPNAAENPDAFVGFGDAGDGIYFGYREGQLGVLHKRGGKPRIMRFRLSSTDGLYTPVYVLWLMRNHLYHKNLTPVASGTSQVDYISLFVSNSKGFDTNNNGWFINQDPTGYGIKYPHYFWDIETRDDGVNMDIYVVSKEANQELNNGPYELGIYNKEDHTLLRSATGTVLQAAVSPTVTFTPVTLTMLSDDILKCQFIIDTHNILCQIYINGAYRTVHTITDTKMVLVNSLLPFHAYLEPVGMGLYGEPGTSNYDGRAEILISRYSAFTEGPYQFHERTISYTGTLTSVTINNFRNIITLKNNICIPHIYYGNGTTQAVTINRMPIKIDSITVYSQFNPVIRVVLIKNGYLPTTDGGRNTFSLSQTDIVTAGTIHTYNTLYAVGEYDNLVFSGFVPHESSLMARFEAGTPTILVYPGETISLAAVSPAGTSNNTNIYAILNTSELS